MFRDVVFIHFRNIIGRPQTIIVKVNLATIFINIRGENTLASQSVHRLMKPANTAKQINKFKLLQPSII